MGRGPTALAGKALRLRGGCDMTALDTATAPVFHKGWYIVRNDQKFILARTLPIRFDVYSDTTVPIVGKARLAQQIRQDLWRELRHLRGFSPVVRVEEDGTHLTVRAGGTLQARTNPIQKIEATIAALLADPKKRARWVRYAGKGRQNA